MVTGQDLAAPGGPISQEEAHLLRRLKGLLTTRNVDAMAGRLRRVDLGLARENRRMVRDCIQKLRQVRAGVSPAWLGLGAREGPRHLG
jgi:hypothetical protein